MAEAFCTFGLTSLVHLKLTFVPSISGVPAGFVIGDTPPSLQSLVMASRDSSLFTGAASRLTALTLQCRSVRLNAQVLPQLARQLQSCILEFVHCCTGVRKFFWQLRSFREVRQGRLLVHPRERSHWYSMGAPTSAFGWRGTCLGSGTCVHCLIKQGLLPRDACRPWRDMRAGTSGHGLVLETSPACIGNRANGCLF